MHILRQPMCISYFYYSAVATMKKLHDETFRSVIANPCSIDVTDEIWQQALRDSLSNDRQL